MTDIKHIELNKNNNVQCVLFITVGLNTNYMAIHLIALLIVVSAVHWSIVAYAYRPGNYLPNSLRMV